MNAKNGIQSGRLELSESEIVADIEKFNNRISECRKRLSLLPHKAETAKQRKRLRETKRKLINEIKLTEIIKGYAQDALRECSSVCGMKEV